MEMTTAIDEQILDKVVNMGYNKEKVLRALAMGHELLTSRKMAAHQDAKKVAVIYNLLRDQKRRKEQAKEDVISNLKQSFQQPVKKENRDGQQSDPPIDYDTMSAAAQSTYRRLSQLSQRSIHNPFPPPSTPQQWQLGCWSREDPLKLMSTLYTLLRKYNFEWKVLSLYKLKARYPAGLVDRQGRAVGGGEVCKIGIQLYRSGGGNGGEGGLGGNRDVVHQLDVHKLYGQMFLFLDLTALLLTDLAQQVHIG
jgi:hypothetical protein